MATNGIITKAEHNANKRNGKSASKTDKATKQESKVDSKVESAAIVAVEGMSKAEKCLAKHYGQPDVEIRAMCAQSGLNKKAVADLLHAIIAASGKTIVDGRSKINTLTTLLQRKVDGVILQQLSNNDSKAYSEPHKWGFLYGIQPDGEQRKATNLAAIRTNIQSAYGKALCEKINVKLEKVVEFVRNHETALDKQLSHK
jgi:hypothetical protein